MTTHVPNDAMRADALAHARLCSEAMPVHTIGDARPARRQAIGTEACGVFFYPDRKLASSTSMMPTIARFVPLTNVHPTPETSYTWDSHELILGITRAYGSVPGGFIQLWHTHLRDVGPSEEDWRAVEHLHQALAQRPLWGPADRHLILQMASGTWVDYGTQAQLGSRARQATRTLS